MSAAKSGNHIYISGTGNTLSSVASDIADTTFCEYDSGTGVFTFKGNVSRYMRIRNGGTLTIGDSTDYTVEHTMNFETSHANYLRFYVDAGGKLEMYGKAKIDMMTGTQRAYYTYIYGAVYIRGSGTNIPIIQNYQRIYWYEQQNNDTYTNDIWDIDGLIFGSACTANYYCCYFNAFAKVRAHKFKNITFDKTYGKGLTMYAMRFPNDVQGIRNITFEDINFHNVGNYPLYVNAARPHFKGTTFGTTTSWKVLAYGCGKNDNRDLTRDYTYNTEHPDGQAFMYLEDCTFENLDNKACANASYNACILFKDCTWNNTASDTVEARYGGRAMIWTGNTFTSREYYDCNYNGAVLFVHALTLTINDENGDPIENAIVNIRQSGGKEEFVFHTDSSGKMRNDHNLDCALLTHKQQYGTNNTTTVETWSDSSNSTYHTATVSVDGYKVYTENYAMSEERSDTIQLTKKKGTTGHTF